MQVVISHDLEVPESFHDNSFPLPLSFEAGDYLDDLSIAPNIFVFHSLFVFVSPFFFLRIARRRKSALHEEGTFFFF